MEKWIKRLRYSGISDDSRHVKKGDLFFAIKGSRFDGRKFIDEAIRKGAAAVVVDKRRDTSSGPRGAEILAVDNPRRTLAQCAADFYGNPSKGLKIIGITGTNGKTTVSHLVAHLFEKAELKTGLIGTIAYRWGKRCIKAANTTPGPRELQELLGDMVRDSVQYCVMEVSSHALDQERVAGIDFKTAVFTNITGEHLDYHKTLKRYRQAKAKLFDQVRGRKGLAVVNRDDASFKDIKKAISSSIVTYGIKKGLRPDVWASEITIGLKGMTFLVHSRDGSFRATTRLVGFFNVYNILAAVCVALNEQIPIGVIKEAIASFKGVAGRLEEASLEKAVTVLIDYAHTDNALTNVLTTVRGLVRKRLIVVFGCGGDRDKLKRPRMGRAASRYADHVIITSDNPRSEDPMSIARAVEKGVMKGYSAYDIIVDRRMAIRKAIAIARPGDCIVIAGKGHEEYQVIGDRVIPFSDREVVRQLQRDRQREGSKRQKRERTQAAGAQCLV